MHLTSWIVIAFMAILLLLMFIKVVIFTLQIILILAGVLMVGVAIGYFVGGQKKENTA